MKEFVEVRSAAFRWLRCAGPIVILLALVLTTTTGCKRDSPPVDPSPPISTADTTPPDDEPGTSSGGDGAVISDGGSNDVSDPPLENTASDSADLAQLRKLSSQDPRVLGPASEYFFSKYDDNGRGVFLKHSAHADAEIRRGAAYGLFTCFGPADQELIDALLAALGDSDPVVRRVALKAMGLPEFPRKIFLDSIERVARHLDESHEPDAQTRAHVARMISQYMTEAQPALAALNAAVKNDSQYSVRLACLQAIYNIARDAGEALPAPTHALTHDPDPRLRRVAAKRLGGYGPASAPAIQPLITALADQGVPARAADDPLRGTDQPVCIAAANALSRIGPPAVPALIQSLQSEDRGVRLLSIRALGDMGATASDAVDPLTKLAHSNDSGEATAAKAALVRIDTP